MKSLFFDHFFFVGFFSLDHVLLFGISATSKFKSGSNGNGHPDVSVATPVYYGKNE